MSTEAPPRKLIAPGIDLVDGVCVEKDMGTYSDAVVAQLGIELGYFVRRHGLGLVLTQGTGYQFPALDHGRLKFPDLSFVRAGRYAGGKVPTKWTTFAPDLVAESVSPNDSAEEVSLKVRSWLESGVRLVWVIYPRSRQLIAFRADMTSRTFQEDDVLTGEDIVPGFEVRVGDIFPPGEDVTDTSL